MGNIFYELLVRMEPYENERTWRAQRLVLEGVEPYIPSQILESKDPSHQTLLIAMRICREYYPEDRPTAVDVKNFLINSLNKIEYGVTNFTPSWETRNELM